MFKLSAIRTYDSIENMASSSNFRGNDQIVNGSGSIAWYPKVGQVCEDFEDLLRRVSYYAGTQEFCISRTISSFLKE